jgi:hypothetical protein
VIGNYIERITKIAINIYASDIFDISTFLTIFPNNQHTVFVAQFLMMKYQDG